MGELCAGAEFEKAVAAAFEKPRGYPIPADRAVNLHRKQIEKLFAVEDPGGVHAGQNRSGGRPPWERFECFPEGSDRAFEKPGMGGN